MSTTDGWLKLNFASCVIRQTRSLRVLVLCSNSNMGVRDLHPRCIIWLLILSSTSFMVGRSRVFYFYLFLMKDIVGRWLPWVLPGGSTGRFYKDDVVHNHSAHGYYITRMEGGVRYAWYCCYMLLNRIKQIWAKTAIHIIRELDRVTFHMKDYIFEWWDEQNRCTCMMQNSKTTDT